MGIDAFLTYPAESLSFVNAIQFAPSTNEGAMDSNVLASEFLATTYLDVAYLPAPAPTAEDLTEIVQDALALRLAVDAVISAQNAGELTVALLQEMVDTAGETHDEAMVARSVGRLLQRLGFECTTATSGADGIAVFAQAPSVWALVVCDVLMSGRNGAETVARLRAVRPELPVLFVSGYAPEVGQLPGGRTGVLSKPFAGDVLAPALMKLVPEAVARG